MNKNETLPISEINRIYLIPTKTIYYRISKGHYRTDKNGDVFVKDVEKIIENPLKCGRPRKQVINNEGE